MQMPRLIIDSVPAKIGITFQKEEIEMEQPPADLEIEQLAGRAEHRKHAGQTDD